MPSFKQYTASGGASEAFSIPSFSSDEIKVYVGDVLKSAGTHYNITNYTANGGTVTWTSGNVPSSGTVRIVRDTKILNNAGSDVEGRATYSAGASLKAGNLNDNQKQALRALEELDDQLIQSYDIENGSIDFVHLDCVKDEDDMASDSDVHIPTQQSVKAYVDANAGKDTTYSISCVDGDNTDEEKIRLTAGGFGSGTDDVVLEAGTGLSVARSGDKITFTNTLSTQLTTEEVQDIVGGMFSGNTETNITATYQDSDGTIDLVSTDTVYTHPNHSGEVTSTGDGATVIASNVVDEDNLKISNSPSNGTFLQYKDGTDELTWATPTDTNTQLSTEQVQDIAGAMFSSNTENGVTVTYQDSDGTIDLEATELYYSGNKKVEATNTGATVTGKLTVTGDLQVDGTNTIVNSTTMTVDDKNIVLASGAANDAAADGGGITLESGDGNKTFEWVDLTDAWTSSEHIHVGDDKKLLVGTSSDLSIYHSTNSFLQNVTNELFIRSDGVIWFQDADGNETFAKFIDNGAVELYHNNVKRFETTATGATVNGAAIVGGNLELNSDSYLKVGAGADFYIYHDGSNTHLDNQTGHYFIRNNVDDDDGGNIYIQAKSQENSIICNDDAGVELYYDNVKKSETYSDGLKVTGDFWIDNPSNAVKDVWFDADGNKMRFYDSVKATFGSSDDLQIYHDSTDSWIKNTTGDLVFESTGDDIIIISNDDVAIYVQNASGSGEEKAIMAYGNGGVELYYDNAKKIETTSAGVTVTGTITGDVAFTQTGTGAVTRTVDAKLKDNINVWDFIPVGTTTASTDCASYFQAAINTGKTVYVPKGTYRIDSTLVLDGNYESLIGDECLPVLLKWTEGPAIQISEPGGTGLNEFSRVENFYIQRKIGGSFTCPNYNATLTESLAGVVVSGHGATVNAAVQMTRISNLRVGNFAIGFFFADCVGVTVHKCFTQNLADYSSATQTADGTTITSSMWGVGYYFNATRYGAGSISPLASIEIVECDDVRTNDPTTIKSVSYLIVGEDPRDIFFQRAESTKADYGWYIDGQSNDDLNWDLHIIRPIIDAFKKHAIYAANLDGVGSLSITGGYFVGLADAEAAIYATNCNGINITGGAQVLGLTNDTGNNTDDGIRLDSCSSCSIIGNRFANLQYAISLNGTTYSTIQGNVISAAASEDDTSPTLHAAIRLFGNSTFNTVGNNTIRGQSASVKYGKGIELASGSDNCKLIGNIIENTTVTTQVDDSASGTGYAGTNGGSTGTDYNDNVKVRLGTGNDLEIYHDGSHSYIKDAGTGTLQILTDQLRMNNAAGSENMIKADEDGSVELYYDHSKKFETASAGIQVTGNIVPEANNTRNIGDGSTNFNSIWASNRFRGNDNVKLNLGGGQDLLIYHDATDNIIASPTGADLHIKAGTGDNANEYCAKFIHDGAVELYYDNNLQFKTTANGCQIDGDLYFDNEVNAGRDLFWDQSADYLKFSDSVQAVFGNGTDLQIWHDGSNSYISNGTGDIIIQSASGHSGKVKLQPKYGENSLTCDPDGAVTLYYNNTKRVQTSSVGVKVYGAEGGDAWLELYADEGDDNADKWGIKSVASDNSLAIQNYASGSWEKNIECHNNSAVILHYDNSEKAKTYADGFHVKGDFWVDNQVNTGKDIWFDESANYLKFYDVVKAVFGDADDLQLYHSGHSVVQNTNAAALLIASDETHIVNNAMSENQAKFIGDGNVELYYDNSKKLETYQYGITVTGNVQVGTHAYWGDNGEAIFGDGSDLKIYHDGSNSKISNTTGILAIGSSEVYIESADHGETMAKFIDDGACKLYYDYGLKLETYSEGVQFTGDIIPAADDTHHIGKSSHRWDNIWATNGTINTSDRNEKNTITESDLGLNFINKLKPISYKWNKDEDTTHYGLIAQDLEEVLNTIDKPISEFGGLNKPDNAPMGLAYTELIAPLIKAIQELSAKVTALEAK